MTTRSLENRYIAGAIAAGSRSSPPIPNVAASGGRDRART
jgi:hypothetical protein